MMLIQFIQEITSENYGLHCLETEKEKEEVG